MRKKHTKRGKIMNIQMPLIGDRKGTYSIELSSEDTPEENSF
jgi:hypothetical protein